MPFTLNGCGTRYYGKREIGPDGSYVTTEWVTFIYLPIIPLRSKRVLPNGDNTNLLVFHSQGFQTGKVPLSWIQIRNVCSIMIPIFAVILYLSWGELTSWVKSEWQNAQPLKVQSAPVDLPLDAKSSMLACGAVMKLEADSFSKLKIQDQISAAVRDAEYTPEEFKNISSEE
jgi:hypothetical protein